MIYLDEAEPGNPLAIDNPTKMWIFYVSFLEFEQWQLQMDDAWLGVATIRTNITKKIAGGIAGVAANLLNLSLIHI